MSDTQTLAFEIGAEEIPAFDLASATKQLEKFVPADLKDARIPFSTVEVLSTPRRLIVIVHDMAVETESLCEEYKGPAVRIAFDADGNPTKAAQGFARGKGLTVDDLDRREVKGVEYVYAVKQIDAIPVINLLPDLLKGFITKISWPRSCRWGTQSVLFVRPVRWIVALFGDQIVPLTFGDVTSGNQTMGHRILAPGPHVVATADDLVSVVRASGVVPTQEEREQIIRSGIAEIEQKTGEKADLPAKTMREVVNLSEHPQALLGTFDEEFLKVPQEIIVDAMLVHQRYFPLYNVRGELTNHFIIVSNGDPACAETIIDGNERVVRARLDDAKFFYEEDLKQPLEAYVDRLDEVVFQKSLGTVRDKTNRLVQLAHHLADDAELSQQDSDDLSRAAFLCKADLVTNAVIEFTSVQGVMGSYYARAAGETDQVADAIAQQYRPRFSGDDAPETTVGRLLALADKLDTICGLFAVDQAPSGSKDPFALRRSAIGIVKMLADGLPISLISAVDCSLASYDALKFDTAAVRTQIIDFFITRTKVMLRDEGCTADAVDAVLAGGVSEPAEIVARTQALESARADTPEVMDDLATAYARAHNLRDESLGCDVDVSLMNDEEQALNGAIETAERVIPGYLDKGDYQAALAGLAALRAPIDTFFEQVMIMDEDADLRHNRLCLLNRFIAVFADVADFGKLAKEHGKA